MAAVQIPEPHRLEVFKMYSYEITTGKTIATYVYKDGEALLPLNLGKLRRVARLLGEDIVDHRSLGSPISSRFILNPEFQLRDYQVTPGKEYLEYIQKHQYGVLSAGCGTGKTIICAYVGGHLGVKQLILIDQSNLISNWEIAYKLIWNRKLQILRNDTTHFEDVSLTTFQLLHRNPDLLRRLRSEYGCTLIDEAHGVTAETFKHVMFRLDNRYRIATSATFYNKHLPTEVLEDICGSAVAVTMVDENALKPRVHFVTTGVDFASDDPNDFTTNTLPALAENDKRNALIIDLIRENASKGRRIIVVAIKKEQVAYLVAKCHTFCRVEEYTGSTTKKRDDDLKTRFEAGNVDCVITCRKFNKGTDYQTADTLILARPYNNQAMTEQLSGRVVRRLEGKPEPWIFDLVDRGSLPWRYAENRHRWYSALGYTFDQDNYYFMREF